VLGKYIEDLDSKDLNISIWGGDIKLNDINLKKDIFSMFKVPLDLIFGQIGELHIRVPWKNLGSSPVEVTINDIQIVVRPKQQADWEELPTLSTDFKLKEEAISEFAGKLFAELLKTEEELSKESGMFGGLVSRIIDNLQVSLTNMHLRIENEDDNNPINQFSLGISLQAIDLFTTNRQWEKKFIDRSLPENKDEPMFKRLEIVNFGVYYKTSETSLISTLGSQEDMEGVLKTFFNDFDAAGRYQKYEDYYLLEPIILLMKLRQNEPQTALKNNESIVDVDIDLKAFGICLQKSQFDNI
jgi:vacuolar protein sorting-associated protein 13A/C